MVLDQSSFLATTARSNQSLLQQSSAFCPANFDNLRQAQAERNFESASKIVDFCLLNDDIRSALKNKLEIRGEQPSASGFQDEDYPNLASVHLTDLQEAVISKRCPLPRDLLDQFAHMQSYCAMGIFPEISRAWISVDSDLFLWNYESGTDMAYFDNLSHTIVQVSLVLPKRGIFQPHVSYLLCVATVVDIVLLAISLPSTSGDLFILPEFLFKIPADGVIINNICSTKSGRIFLAGKDSCLYELDYQDKGWFRRSCQKINHSKGLLSYFVPTFLSALNFAENEPLAQLVIDETRNVLYARSETGSLQLFDLGVDGYQTIKICSFSSQAIQHAAIAVAQNVEPTLFKAIIHIDVISCFESVYVTLVGVTQRGVRLYFSCYYADVMNAPEYSPNLRPQTLRLIHIRFPPGFSASSSVGRPSLVYLSLIKSDLAVVASAVDDNSDRLWLFSNANFPFAPRFSETMIEIPINGRSWVIHETTKPGLWNISTKPRLGGFEVLPASVARQQFELPRTLVVLSAQGVTVVEVARPVDSLASLLLSKGPNSPEVRGFVQLHGAEQACSMCLILICCVASQPQLVEVAKRAFFHFSGDPFFSTENEVLEVSQGFRPPLSNAAPTNFGNVQQQPLDRSGQLYPTPADRQPWKPHISSRLLNPQQFNTAEVCFSACHNSLYYYLARIARCIWNKRLVVQESVSLPNKQQQDIDVSALKSEDLAALIDQLRFLKDFMTGSSIVGGRKNLKNASPPGTENIHRRMLGFMRPDLSSMTNAQQQLYRKYQCEAAAVEQQSVDALFDILQRSLEVLGLWKILSEHQLHVVIRQLPQDLQDCLRKSSFRHLIVSGKDICADLCTCLISQYVGDHATVDAIVARLRSACPTLYTSDDATMAKASEVLHSAKSIADNDTQDRGLQEALSLYKKAAQTANLAAICKEFEEALFYDGVVELALASAKKCDARDLGLAYYRNKDASGDTDAEAKKAYEDRMLCYRCIIAACDRLLDADAVRDPRLVANLTDHYLELVLKMVFDSDDELCHVAFYDWLIQKGLSEKLLIAKSSYLEFYLQAAIKQGGPGVIVYTDLLWKFYERNQQYLQAAKLLERIADIHSTSIDLVHRINLLTRAVVCAKCCDAESGSGNFMQAIEDKLEVAGLQLKLLESIKQLPASVATHEAVAKLNAELFDITQLYANFAEEFNLPECRLAIVKASGFNDNALVESLWEEIIEAELALHETSTADVKMKALASKLSQLSSSYGKCERCFPVGFLIKFLLSKSFDDNFDSSWLPETCLKLTVSPATIRDVFDSLYKVQTSRWYTNRKARVFLLRCCLHLFNQASASFFSSEAERKSFVTQCSDNVAAYLIDLQSQGGTRESAQLYDEFSAVQKRFEKITRTN